jgi:DNA-binding response OmpR family regulator
VAVVASGALALRSSQRVRFDIVLVDAALPDRPAIDVLNELRAHGDVPVILLGSGDSVAE